ncbi:hypothetical protein E1200_30290 [Actinomadura sp. GC306]|uniref:hypothetical protein n=1 Tax=Actinomadura sp. GC306 TaxID=2530367 RepID=UPI0010442E4D|nr:hypothetical protein [Actinomadura sp. GC306]TDC60534.1 hypothetical protein E1200_30290 [Actinomadura sp. GC306]
MNRWRTPFRAAGAAAAGAVLATGLAAGLAVPASAAARGGFEPVPLPFFWPNNNLYDVAAASPDSVWIAGNQGELVIPGPIPGTGTLIPGNPVVRRWQAGRWVEYDLQGLRNRGTIMDVDAAGPEDVWITGPKYGADNATTPYLARFTGSAFAQVALPPGAGRADLQARASGVWLVTGTDVHRRTGDTWTHVAALPGIEVETVHVRADDDVWALGTAAQDDPALVARHWDGREWRDAPVNRPSGNAVGFTGMVAVSPAEAWAIGYTDPGPSNVPLLMRWDGTAWTSVAPPAGLNGFSEIVQGEDGTLWIVGHAVDAPAEPGLLRYAGGAWERVPTTAVPNRSSVNPTALAVVPGTGALWTLGTVNIGGPVVLRDG